eukprot:gene1613-1953_t
MYNLQVVPRNQLPANYCTISATGVVQVVAGADSVFTPIGTWIRDANMHQLLKGLKAFDQLWLGNSLRRWRLNVRQLRYQRSRQQLSQKLLLLKAPYLRTLMECRSKLAQVQTAGAFESMPPGLCQLETMVAQQQEYHLSKITPLLARTIAAIVVEVEQMAGRLQDMEQQLARELLQYNKDPSQGAKQGVSPIKFKAAQDAAAAKHAAAVADLQRMPAFLRLLALLVMQLYMDLLVGTVASIKAHVEAPGNALMVNLLLEAAGVSFKPSMEELLKGFSKGIVEHLVGVLRSAPRPLMHPTLAALLVDPVNSRDVIKAAIAARERWSSGGGSVLAQWPVTPAQSTEAHGTAANAMSPSAAFFLPVTGGDAAPGLAGSGTANAAAAAAAAVAASKVPGWLTRKPDEEPRRDGGQLLMMIVGDRRLGELRRVTDQQVMRSYREAQQVADSLSGLGVLLTFSRTWNAAGYKAKCHTVAQMRRDALLLREWQAQLQVILDHQSVGILQLQTKSLKDMYMTRLQAAQATLAMKLVSTARKEAEALVAQLQALARELGQQPSKLSEFIEFKVRAKEVGQLKEEVAVLRPFQVTAMYATVTDWTSSSTSSLPHTDQVLIDDLKDAVRGFNRWLSSAQGFLDSRNAGMVALLDRQAKELLRSSQDFLKKLEAASLNQRLGSLSAAPGSVVLTHDKLKEWQEQLQHLTTAARLINDQEGQMATKVTHYDDLPEAGRVLQEIQAAAAGSVIGSDAELQ